jgi:hypothetical protein
VFGPGRRTPITEIIGPTIDRPWPVIPPNPARRAGIAGVVETGAGCSGDETATMTEGSNVAAEPIADPIVNGPYDPPQRHFELGADGSPTGVIVSGRRPSESFIPVPAVTERRRQAAVQESFDLGSDGERREANTLINDIRYQVELWRNRNYPGATAISRKLMLHWAEPSRENRVLYCQREAAETAIYLAEVAGRHGEPDFRTRIDPQNALHNDGLSHRPRPACRCVDERPARRPTDEGRRADAVDRRRRP